MDKLAEVYLLPNQVAPEYYFSDYLFFQCIGLAFWFSAHMFMDFVMKDTNYRYMKKSIPEMCDYRSNAIAIFHGIVACCLAFYCMFAACGEGNNFFNSTECANVPRNITILAATFSGSYFMADLILIIYHTGMQTTL